MRVVVCWLILAYVSTGILRGEELPRATPEQVGLSSSTLAGIDSVVQASLEKNQTAGAVVLVARHGKIAYLKAFGKMDVDTENEMRDDAIFRIQSMTKPITTVAALVLYEDGKCKLDDPVSKYLPEFNGLRVHSGDERETVEIQREMTIRDLMRHTAGLTYGLPNGSAVDKLYIQNKIGSSESLADLVTKLSKLPLEYQPGTRFHYSFSTDVLGRLVEVVAEKPLDEFLADRVFLPLDMRDTGFVVPEENLSRFASSHRRDENGALKVTDAPATSRYRTKRTYLSAGGGLVSTARDYSRFCQMLLNGGELLGTRLLRTETVREMTTNQLPAEALPMTLAGFPQPGLGFGLGLAVQMEPSSPDSRIDIGEFGWSGAASTYFWAAPDVELITVILQQVEPFNFELQLGLKPLVYSAIEK